MTDPVAEITLPPLIGPAAASWRALLEVGERLPDHWCLIGGAMVMLHCVERGTTPTRPSQALNRAERVVISTHDGKAGMILRPSLLGALVLKAAAIQIPEGSAGNSHLKDFCSLAPLAGRRTLTGLTPKDKRRLRAMLQRLDQRPDIPAGIDGAVAAIGRIRLAAA